MINEEIFEYAQKALKNQEKRCNSIIVGTAFLFIVGYSLIYWTSLEGVGYIRVCCLAYIIVSLIIYIVCLFKYMERYAKMRRNYQYNLVRKDEREKNGTF